MSGIAITFPSSPTEGQSYLAQNGFTYIYDSQKNRWKRGGEFVRAPKVLSYAGVAATTTGAGIITGPTGALLYNIPGVVLPNSEVGVDSYKAYRASDSYPNYTEVQVSISSAFSTIAYAATFTGTTHTIPSNTLSGDTTYYLRARQFVGSSAAAAGVGAISGYSQNPVRFITTSVYLDTPTIVSIAGTTQFPAYQIGFAGTTLPATVTYFGSGVGNLQQVEWRVTGPRNPDSTGNTALAEVGIGTFSSATLANALVLAMPFSGATGVGITNDVNNAIRTASGASAGAAKTSSITGSVGIVTVGIATTTSHFYNGAAYFSPGNSVTYYSPTDFDFGTLFTMEAWIYPVSGTAQILVFDWRPGNTTGIAMINADGALAYWNYPTNVASTGKVQFNSWNHCAWVFSNNIVNFYINGVFVGNGSASVAQPDSSYVVINGQSQGTFYIQDVKIYKGLAKYQENFTPPLPTYGTISYTTRTIGSVGVATTAFFESTGDIPLAEVAIGSSTAAQVASSLVLAMPMNRTFGFQDINVAVRGLTSGASAGTAKTVGLGTTSTANAPSQPIISSTESKWYDGAAYFDGGDHITVTGLGGLNPGAGSWTIEGWFYFNSLTNNDVIFNGTDGSGDDLYLNYLGSTLYVGDGITNTIAFVYKPINQWVHLACIRDGSTYKVFGNGVLITSSGTGLQNTTLTTADIGRRLSQNAYFNGYIQDYRIYNFAKYTANFTPPRPICGFTTDLAIQTGFTTTSATGIALTSIVGLGSTSTLAFAADQTYAGITSITSSSGITTLPDPYAQNLVLALPLANITGVGNSFTNDRNTQIRSVSITGAGVTAGTTKTVTNTNVSLATTNKWYGGSGDFKGTSVEKKLVITNTGTDFTFGTGDFTFEWWGYHTGAAPSNGYLFDMVGQPFFIIRKSNGSFTIGNGPETTVLDIGAYPYNQWTHIAIVRNSGIVNSFVDGTLRKSVGFSTNLTGADVEIGSATGDTTATYNYDGYIQDLRIYKGLAKYTTNFTPPPPMFGDYTRSTPNKVVFTPGSDYVLEARNTATGGIVTSVYSATRQWGTKPKGGIYDPYASNLVLAIPGGAVGGATSTFDITGQIRYETPTASYVNAGIVTYTNTYALPVGVATYGNKSVTNTGPVSISSTITKYYSRSMQFNGSSRLQNTSFGLSTTDLTMECWAYYSDATSVGTLIELNSSTRIILQRLASTGLVSVWYGTAYNGSITIPAAIWTHVAFVKRGTTINLFVNGIMCLNFTGSFGTVSSETVTIGRNSDNFEPMNGYIQDVRIYNIAKYTSNFTPPNQIFLT